MNREELEQKINEYAKKISLHIIKEYRNNLGIQNVLLLDKVGTELKVTFTPSQKDTLYVPLPKETNSSDIAFEILKRQIPYLLFSLVIDIQKNLSVSKEDYECMMTLESGLRKIYTTHFCNVYHYVEDSPNIDISIAEVLLNMEADGIDKNNMVFQTNYDYMKQMYFISTKKNLLHTYENLKRPKEQNLSRVMNAKKTNGYFNGILLILFTVMSGVLLTFFTICVTTQP